MLTKDLTEKQLSKNLPKAITCSDYKLNYDAARDCWRATNNNDFSDLWVSSGNIIATFNLEKENALR